uniref:Secreted protein n=1 Tax=Steinernema glaseri TaxID=37863 RepID=A0A1I7YWA3_9BILA
MVTSKLLHLFISLFAIMLLTAQQPLSRAAPDSEFFDRHPKWTRLTPSGGSLVSGRGNFRPGFYSHSQIDPRIYLSEPSFAFKRSYFSES